MANPITGDFDVVVEAGVATVNRILAAQHQAEKFLHSFSGRLDDTSPFGGALEQTKAPVQLVRAPMRMEEPRPPRTLALAPIQSSEDKKRPVLAVLHGSELLLSINNPQQKLYRSYGPVLGREEHTGVRGFVEVQVSPPTITIPADSTSQVTAHWTVMVHFLADAGTPALPEFLHGEARVTVDVDQVAWQSGGLLEIDLSADDIEVAFNSIWADPPLAGGQSALITKVIRNVLRTKFDPVNAILPQDVRQLHFKLIPDNLQPAVIMMLDLRDNAPPNPDPAEVTRIFLKDDWAIAAGREFLIPTLTNAINKAPDDPKDGFRDKQIQLDIPLIDGWHVHPTYSLHSDVTVDLQPGQIVVTITGSAHSPDFYAPDFNYTVTQSLGCQVIAGVPVLNWIGDGNISVSNSLVDLFKNYFAGEWKSIRDTFLPKAQSVLRETLDNNSSLGALLQGLNVTAELAYTSIEIQTDGIILQGALSLPAWNPVHVDSSGENAPTKAGGTEIELNAFNSWIPGGTITEFVWTVSDPPSVIKEPHRFITRVPGDLSQGTTRWCLKVEGNRISASGAAVQEAVTGKTPNCKILSMICSTVSGHNPLLNRLTVALVQPVPEPGPGPISSTIVADIDPLLASLGAANDGTNLLVCFGDSESDSQFVLVRQALSASRKKESAIMLVAVLPQGSLAKLKPSRLGANVSLVVTEDVEGNWRKTFGVNEGPAFLIVNPSGHTVWRQLGRIGSENLTSALNEHLQPGGRIRQRQLRIAAQVGRTAPDFLFEYSRVRGAERSRERWMALHDLRGRQVLLVFWTVWSKPSLEELRHLEETLGDSSRPVVLAINDGDDEDHALNLFGKNGFTHQLILDRERQISRRYAINCWPTLIAIDRVGRVASIHFGVTPGEAQFQGRDVRPRD